MKKIAYTLSLNLFLLSLLELISLFSQNIFLPEIFIMLLPYWLALNLILLLISLLLQSKLRFKINSLKISTFILIISSFSLFFRLFNFSYAVLNQGTGSRPLTLTFFNKLYSNTNYPEIDQKLRLLKPDLIGFSEFKTIDSPQIHYLNNYQYHFSKPSRDNATISFYTNFPTQLDQNAANLNYVLPLNVQINNQPYHVFVIHPLPPSNSQWVQQRNSELSQLASYINSLHTPNIIVLGDFNLSPWSQTYQNLASNLTSLKDTSKGQGLQFTWHGDFINTQIDHIFVPKSAFVSSFQADPVLGSDHNLIWTTVKI